MRDLLTRRSAVVALAALLLVGCGDDPSVVDQTTSGSTGNAATDDTEAPADEAPDTDADEPDEPDDADDQADDEAPASEEPADEPGADGAPGTAEVLFQGTTYQMTAERSLDCFVRGGGDAQGGVSFEGADDEGNRLAVDWAADTPDAAVATLELADGSEWTSPFTEVQFDVTVTPPSAVLTTSLVSLTDGSQDDIVVRPICP